MLLLNGLFSFIQSLHVTQIKKSKQTKKKMEANLIKTVKLNKSS